VRELQETSPLSCCYSNNDCMCRYDWQCCIACLADYTDHRALQILSENLHATTKATISTQLHAGTEYWICLKFAIVVFGMCCDKHLNCWNFSLFYCWLPVDIIYNYAHLTWCIFYWCFSISVQCAQKETCFIFQLIFNKIS